MDLSTADILAGLAMLAALAGAGAVVYTRKYARKRSPAAPVNPEDTGRHHVPRGLLDDPTAKLSPETVERSRQQPGP